MDNELEEILSDLGERTSYLFTDFMMRTAKFEELVDIGHRFLTAFYQQLEVLRRPQLYKTSNVVDSIIEASHTDRMKAYVEAGCRHSHLAIQNISKLHSCGEGLRDHLKKVKVLLDELECIKEDAIGFARTGNQSVLQFLDKYYGNGVRHEILSLEEEDIVDPVHLEDKSVHYAAFMTVIYDMLRLDCRMQEKIITSLHLNTSASELESYCLMWNLRPYIDDNFMRLGWTYVRHESGSII